MARRVWQLAVVLLTAAAAPPRVAAMYTNVDVMAALIADTKHYESAFMESVGEMREYESKFARIVKSREAAQAAQAQAAQAAHHNHPSAATRLVRSGARLPLRRIPVDASASRLVGRKLTQDDPAVVGVADPLKPANVPVLAGADGGGGGAGARARNPDSDHAGAAGAAQAAAANLASGLDSVITDAAVVEALVQRQKAYAAYLEQKALVAELVEAMEEATPAFTHAFGRCAVTNDGGCIVSENDMDNPNSGASNHIHRRLHQMAGDSSMECPTKDFAALMATRGIPLPPECQQGKLVEQKLLDGEGGADTHCTIRVNKPVTLKVVRWELNTCRADALWESGTNDQDTCSDLMTINGIPFFMDKTKGMMKAERSPHDLVLEKGELIRWLSTSSGGHAGSSYWKLCEADTYYDTNHFDDLPALLGV